MAARHASREGAGTIVKGYKLMKMPVAAGSIISRDLLVKRHKCGPGEEHAEGRSLFVTHLDNFVTEKQLSRCFSRAFGAVEKVELKSTPKKAPKAEQRADHVKLWVNFARVVFSEAESLEKALAAANGRIVGTAVLPLPESELDRISKDEDYRDPVELKKEVDAWLANFDREEAEKKRLARQSAVVDDDGFTKVVSGTSRTADGFAIRAAARPALKTGAFSEPLTIIGEQGKQSERLGRNSKKKKNKEMPDFYRFQMREQRHREIVDHRKRKVEDEEKVYRLKKKLKVQTAAFVEKPKKKGQ